MKNANIPSVGKIIFWFIIFYPIGFFFLFKRIKMKNLQEMQNHMYYPDAAKNTQYTYYAAPGTARGEYRNTGSQAPAKNDVLGSRYKNISIAEIAGSILFAMEGLGSIFAGGNYSTAFTSIGISLILIWLGYRRSAKLTRYQPYLNYLASYESTYVSDIARCLGRDEISVRSDLADMIGCKMIDAKLSGDGRLILAGRENSAPAGESAQPRKRTVTCPHCGAPTTIYPGSRNNCEYCGLSIEE